jgi:hypothetical protein|tara:strand:- start:58 stop:222 length:165 start_codon:yes stop_codon:yes gene_type:complete
MSINIWLIIGVVTILVWGWIIYEFINSPVMPPDYDCCDENKDKEKNNQDGNSND